MFPSGPPEHLYDNSDATDRKPQQQPLQHPPSRGPYLTTQQQQHQQHQQQQHLPPSNSNPPIPFYQPPPTLVQQHQPPEQRLHQHYPHYDYSLRIPITMDEQLHPALGYLPDQTQGRGSASRDDYDPTLTPIPTPAVLRHHRQEQEPVMMLFPSPINDNLMSQHPSPWDDSTMLPSQVIPPPSADPVPNSLLRDYDRNDSEQELFGRLVSMARSDRSNIWQQQQHSPSWLPQFTEKSSSMLLPPSFGEASTSTAHDIEFPAPQQQLQQQQQTPWQRKDEYEYRLEIIQQPSRARMCGFGDKDRRPISPPPILQLFVRARDGRPVLPQDVDTSFFVALCDCFDETGTKPANMLLHSIPLPTSQQQQQSLTSSSSTAGKQSIPSTSIAKQTVRMKNLVGSCIASPSKLYNEQRQLGIFFVFHDLSLRSEGRFRLSFSLTDIGSPDSQTVNTNSISHVLTTATSDVFTAYTAKNFPGVVPPTSLSQCFAKQGVKIPTRRDTKSKRKKISEAKEEDEAR